MTSDQFGVDMKKMRLFEHYKMMLNNKHKNITEKNFSQRNMVFFKFFANHAPQVRSTNFSHSDVLSSHMYLCIGEKIFLKDHFLFELFLLIYLSVCLSVSLRNGGILAFSH